ncbi:MAG TPA: sigma-70 family RNA polymerase sigma factor, partial [Solirubrobacterales bacterium]|nr:sigma-70 family RNA polymerase sigma factor [Solirubrobacterales bacterium]
MFAAGGTPVRGTATETTGTAGAQRRPTSDAGRKRAAIELIRRDGERLRRTARRYSLCAEDAEDAYQRGLEILLTKAPTEQPRELLAWTTTVVKHEALAVRRARERLLGLGAVGRDEEPDTDPVARLPSPGAGPLERLERREEIARGREAIRALKPAERRTLALLAEGYSYAEIGEITGFSKTKVNRCLAEGRERFRRIVASSEDGSRCAELRPLLSAFCDGEAGPRQSEEAREHLRACGRCRATMRAYRAAPATVAALSPLPLVLGEATGVSKVIGLGKLSALKKAVAVCVVTGAGAGVATGVIPTPKAPSERPVAPRVERIGAGAAPPARPREERAGSRRPDDEARRPAPAPPPEPTEAAIQPGASRPAPPPVEPVEPEPTPAPEPVEPEPAPAVEPVESEPAPAP